MSIFDDLTWKCRVCGDERPDAKISVFQRVGQLMTQNFCYCNDRPECVEGVEKLPYIVIDRAEDGDPTGFRKVYP